MNIKKLAFSILEVIFIGVIPIILILIKYGEMGDGTEQTTFKVGVAGILLAILVLIILKRIVLNKWLENMNEQANNYVSIIKTETDTEKVERAKSVLKGIRTLQTILNAILPALIFIVGLIACNALEQEIVKLSSCVGLIFVSFLIGTIFSVLSAREV